jgi:ubiquinone/menaquinone biosynthesis C-methylase UbiE
MNRKHLFSRLAHKWDEMRRPDMAARLERVIRAARLRAGQQVLDVGTGTGVLVPLMLKMVGKQGRIVGLDFSHAMLARARAKGFPYNVTFIQRDIQKTRLPAESFHRVICNAAMPHFPDKQAAVNEMARLLRPGGLLVVSHPIGRKAVRRLHREMGRSMAKDLVPTPRQLERLFCKARLQTAAIIDDPDFYLALARKPLR